MASARPVVAAALAAFALGGCGGGGGGESTSTSTRSATESAQAPASLPTPWHRHVDARAGLSIGIPPGWRAHHPRRSLLISSPDRLVAVSVAADRGAAARALPLDRFARSALAALPGYRSPLDPGPPRPFAGTPLDAVRVGAVGVAAGGVPERVTLVALRRHGVASFTLVAVANRHAPPADRRRALAISRTLRDRPAGQAAGRSGRSG
jgi:hypothetical protein